MMTNLLAVDILNVKLKDVFGLKFIVTIICIIQCFMQLNFAILLCRDVTIISVSKTLLRYIFKSDYLI